MRYYAVTEGQARVLDRVHLRDRATYGLDWMVFEATSPADAVRQWEHFKAGTHVRQAGLELEVSNYRGVLPGRPVPGYAAPWEADLEAVALRETGALSRPAPQTEATKAKAKRPRRKRAQRRKPAA
jgi:hypothetical protein